MKKPMYKRVWFWIVAVLAVIIIVIGSKAAIYKHNEDILEAKKAKVEKAMKISFSKGDYVEFDFDKEAEYFDSRVDGTVTVKGHTKPNSKVSFEDYTTHNESFNAKTTSDSGGHFTFKFNLGHNLKKLSGWIKSNNGKDSDQALIYIQNNDAEYWKKSDQKKSEADKKQKQIDEKQNKIDKSEEKTNNVINFTREINESVSKSKGEIIRIDLNGNDEGTAIQNVAFVVGDKYQYASNFDLQDMSDTALKAVKDLSSSNSLDMPSVQIKTESGTVLSQSNETKESMNLNN